MVRITDHTYMTSAVERERNSINSTQPTNQPKYSSILFSFSQQANSDMTVIAFLIFPARTNNYNVESLRGQAISKQLRDTVSHVQNQIGKRLFEIALR